jgi:hypothetical protein
MIKRSDERYFSCDDCRWMQTMPRSDECDKWRYRCARLDREISAPCDGFLPDCPLPKAVACGAIRRSDFTIHRCSECYCLKTITALNGQDKHFSCGKTGMSIEDPAQDEIRDDCPLCEQEVT